MRHVLFAAALGLVADGSMAPAQSQELFSVYSTFDARSPGANEAARKLADEKARGFKCGRDDPNK